MAEKVTGKDLKALRQPDEFQIVAGKALEWILAHQRLLLLVVGGAVAVALLSWGAATYKSHGETKAGEQLAEALRIEARPIAGEGFAPPGEETFPSKAERTKAATDAFEKVRSQNAGSLAARTATLQLGLLKQQTGDPAGAIPLLQEFLKDAPAGNPMKPTALEALGYAQESTGKLAEARDSFTRLKEAGAPDRSAYQLARLALLEGKPDAKALLQQVAKDYPKDAVALEANLRVELAGLPPAAVGAPSAEAPKDDDAPAPAPKKPAPKKPAQKQKGK